MPAAAIGLLLWLPATAWAGLIPISAAAPSALARPARESGCALPVSGSSGTLLETKVHFEKNSDHTWRIKSF